MRAGTAPWRPNRASRLFAGLCAAGLALPARAAASSAGSDLGRLEVMDLLHERVFRALTGILAGVQER